MAVQKAIRTHGMEIKSNAKPKDRLILKHEILGQRMYLHSLSNQDACSPPNCKRSEFFYLQEVKRDRLDGERNQTQALQTKKVY